MILEYLIKYKFLIALLILPLIAFIIKKIISFPIKYNKFKQFNEKSYFAPTNKFILKNKSMENNLNIQDYNNTRIYFETKNNTIYLYLTLSKENYYNDKRIEFSIYLDVNNYSNITYINNSLCFSENFENNTKIIQFKKIKESFFNMKKNYLLKYISFNFDANYTNLECKLFFEDFDLIFQLQKEKYTYKIFYLLESLMSSIFLFIIVYINKKDLEEQDYNLQNISVIFLYIIRTKIIISLISKINLLKYEIPIFKIFKFFIYLLIYRESILSLFDIIIIIILSFYSFNISYFFKILYYNIDNYYYCFNNKIENNEIVPNKDEITFFDTNYIQFSIIFILVLICDITRIPFFNFIPLYIGIISAIIKQLTQREISYLKDKKFCINFYFYGIIIYSYYLFINSIGAFYLVKNTFSLTPFFIIYFLYLVFCFVIKNKYKFTFIMKEDFERLKKIDKERCGICLKRFYYKEKNKKNLFCKVNQDDNIHKTNCNHFFHEKCLFNWRRYNNICPLCKNELNNPKYYYFYDYTLSIYKWV